MSEKIHHRLIGAALARASGIVASLALNLWLVALLAPELFGAYSFLVSLFSLALVTVLYGSDVVMLRNAELLRCKDGREMALLGALVRVIAYRFVPVTILLLIAIKVAWPGELLESSLLAALFPGMLFYCWLRLISAFRRAMGDAVAGALSEFLLRPLFMLLLVSAVVISGHDLSIEMLMLFYLASGFLAFSVLIGSAGTGFVRELAARAISPADEVVRMRSGQGSLGWSAIASVLFIRADNLILPSLLGQYHFGIYAFGRYVLNACNSILQLINTQLGPEMVVKFREGGRAALLPVYTAVALLSAALFGALLVAWWFIGEQLLSTYTSFPTDITYDVSWAVLIWSAIGALIGPVFLLYRMLGRPQTIFRVNVAIGLTTILMFIVLASFFGLAGAVVALLVDAIMRKLISGLLVTRMLKAQP